MTKLHPAFLISLFLFVVLPVGLLGWWAVDCIDHPGGKMGVGIFFFILEWYLCQRAIESERDKRLEEVRRKESAENLRRFMSRMNGGS